MSHLAALELEVSQAGGVFAAFEAAAQALFLAALGANFFALLLFLGPHSALEGEADFSLFAIDAENLHIKLLAVFEGLFGLLDFLVGDFADVEQALEAGFELDEDAEVGNLGY